MTLWRSSRIAVACCMLAAGGLGCAALLDLEPLELFAPPADAAAEAQGDGGMQDATSDGQAHLRCRDRLEHDFCDDFEELTRADERWAGREVSGGGTVVLGPADGGGNAFYSSIPSADGGPPAAARIVKVERYQPRGDGATPDIDLAFTMRVASRSQVALATTIALVATGDIGPERDSFIAVVLSANAADNSYTIRLEQQGRVDGGLLVSGCSPTIDIDDAEGARSLDVRLTIVRPGGPGEVRFTVSGETATCPLMLTPPPNEVGVRLGCASRTTAVTSWSVAIDDVILDWR